MDKKLLGRKIAILVCDGFEEIELTEPRKALEGAGAITQIIAPHAGKIKAWNHTNWGNQYDIDLTLDDAETKDYDALLLPGGVLNPDKLRTNELAIEFVEHFIETNKPIAAICHGPWTLVEAENFLQDKHLTSYHSIKTDLINAGAKWYDKEVVVDGNLITSRHPGDLPIFIKTIIDEFAKDR